MKSKPEKTEMNLPKIVSPAEWAAAQKQFLIKEKEFTRQRDALAAERRRLPMEEIKKEYVFQGPEGRRTLADLFEGKRQLLVYHFMFEPDQDEGCPSCSFVADNFAGSLVHLAARDTAFAVISRAPLDKIDRFKKRMGWRFNWASSYGSEFNYDYRVSFTKEQLASGKVRYNFEEMAAPRRIRRVELWCIGAYSEGVPQRSPGSRAERAHPGLRGE
jgi:predicted dithiol-disulfide oxidoreductase (DUF899 family)